MLEGYNLKRYAQNPPLGDAAKNLVGSFSVFGFRELAEKIPNSTSSTSYYTY